MSKVLVTGASGFIGSALCNTLFARDIPFVGAVRKKSMHTQFEVGDLTPGTRWSEALIGCDVVVHLAARVHVMADNSSDPLSAFREMNVNMTLNLARQAAEQGIRRFVFVSSVKVNGDETSDRAFTAFDSPAPADPYGQSKLEAENALMELSRRTGLEVVIIRPPLVYGPGVGANFSKLMKLVKAGVPLPFSSIRNRRSIVALDNLVDLLIAATQHPAAPGHTFLVSDNNDISTPDLMRMISRNMGNNLCLFPVPVSLLSAAAAIAGKSPEASRLIGSLQVDIRHTMATLDWNPVVDMESAVNRTVAHFLS